MNNIKQLFKNFLIKTGKTLVGEDRLYNFLLWRGLKVRHLTEFYRFKTNQEPTNESPTLIFMADGKCMHGGLTDRLKGIVGAWAFAKKRNLKFKIFHKSPFSLEDILQPAKVQWKITDKELSFDRRVAKPVLLYHYDFNNETALERQLDSFHQQFHLYSCVDLSKDSFADCFHELFRPAPILQNLLDAYREKLQRPYLAISFRFQNLLGDFHEWKFKSLSEDEKEDLVERAENAIKAIKENHPKYDTLLITADSPSFLARVSKWPGVVTVDGCSTHIDFDKNGKIQRYLKSFVEFFLISEASEAILYTDKKFKTYLSAFPQYAAKLKDIPFSTFQS